jgi:hypothetical protein
VAVVAAAVAAAAAAVVRPCFLPMHFDLSSRLKGAKHIKHTRRAAGDPCETQWVTRTAAAARTWTGTRAATVVERSWFWVKKTGSKHCRGAPAACNAARTARCRCCHCCRRCYVFPVPLPGCCVAAVAVASKAAKNILGARPGRALLSHAWRLGRAAAGADGPGYRAPRLRLSSCVGQRYFDLARCFCSCLFVLCLLKVSPFGFQEKRQ